MDSFFRMIISNPVVRAKVLAAARHGASFVSGLVLALLLRHGINTTDAQGVASDIGDLLVFAVSIGYSFVDVNKVNTNVQTLNSTISSQNATLETLKAGKA